jgi:hypothetical protein
MWTITGCEAKPGCRRVHVSCGPSPILIDRTMTAETGSCRCLPGRINRRIDLERSRRGGDPRLRQDFTVAGKRLLFRRRRMFRAARYDVRRGFFAVAPQGARRSRRVQIEFVTWSMDVLARRGKLSLRCASGVMRAGSSRSSGTSSGGGCQGGLVWRRMPVPREKPAVRETGMPSP